MKKLIIITALAGAITIGLFSFMAFLINSDELVIITDADPVFIDVMQAPEDSNVEEKQPVTLEPPVPPAPIPRVTLLADKTNVDNNYQFTPTPLNLSNKTTILDGFNHAPNNDARPLFRVNPKYPIDAARNGTEGWVILAFDINAIGAVTNIKIVDSQPKRIFDKAARQALRKWKYRAKSVDGKQLVQTNLTVQLDFNMEESAGI